MFEIGNSLREARLRQSLDYPDIERVTKIRAKYLRALEDESFETLPAQTYVKGFLRTYAEFLGLDGQLYVDEYNSRYVTREDDVPFRPRRNTSRPAGARFGLGHGPRPVVGIAVVCALVIAAWRSGRRAPRRGRRRRWRSRPPAQADLVIRATRGTSQVEVRDRNRFGRERFSGTLAKGRQQRIALRGQLWLWLQRPQAVQVVFAGTPQRITSRRPTAFLVTKRGLQARQLEPYSLRPRAVVVVTGSELVRGERTDRNGPFLARELLTLGLEPARIEVVGDAEAELEDALRDGLRADLLVTSGGLGPTHDDRTVELLARVTGRALHVDDELQAQIESVSRAVAERLRRPYTDFEAGVRKQASLPAARSRSASPGRRRRWCSSTNARSSSCCRGRRASSSGSGRRARVRARAAVLARARPPQRRVLRFFGASESAVARALEDAGGERPGSRRRSARATSRSTSTWSSTRCRARGRRARGRARGAARALALRPRRASDRGARARALPRARG